MPYDLPLVKPEPPRITIPRRSAPELAGIYCRYSDDTGFVCMNAARYAITWVKDGIVVAEQTLAACAQHMPLFTRMMWSDHDSAAVVQEIPGMWRDKPADPKNRRSRG